MPRTVPWTAPRNGRRSAAPPPFRGRHAKPRAGGGGPGSAGPTNSANSTNSVKQGVLPLIGMTLVLVLGLGILLYPAVASYINSHFFGEAAAAYTKEISILSKAERQAMLKAAHEYNESLRGDPVKDPFVPGSGYAIPSNYEDVLNVDGKGLIGTIDIPSIDVDLPIRHGTSEQVLLEGVGHIPETSLPVGGAGTHSVLTSHTGIPDRLLFTNLSRMKKGDVFIIDVVGQRLAYKVDQISVVKPDDLSKIKIVSGKDYVTLLTCTPYGINSHRLLVRGVPTELPDDDQLDRMCRPMPWWLLGVLVGCLVVCSVTLMVVGLRKQDYRRMLARLRREAGGAGAPSPGPSEEGGRR